MPTAMGFRNYCKTGTLSANSQASGMPPTNLAHDVCAPSVGWQTKAGDVTPPNALLKITSVLAASSWRLFGLFRTNLTSSAQVTFTTWVSSGGGSPTSNWQAVVNGPPPGYGQVVAVAPSDQVADFVQIQVSDANNPDGFINVGGCYAGPAWFPASGLSWSSGIGRTDQTTKNTSRGGQQYPQLQWQARTWDADFQGVRAAEMWSQLDVLRQTARTGANVLFIPDTASAYLQYEATFGLLADTANVTFPGKAGDRRAWRATITERL